MKSVITTTVDHPFYVKEHGFVNACELWIGAILLDSNDNILTVENTRLELAEKIKRTLYGMWDGRL